MMGSSAAPAPPHIVASDFLSTEEREALLQWAIEHETGFRTARLDYGVATTVRDGRTFRDVGPLAEVIRHHALARLTDWITRLKVTPFEPSLVELELAAYNDGAHFTIHGDTYRSDQPAFGDRMLSAVYYFHREPRGFTGGALRLHRLGAKADDRGVDIMPEQGRLVVFPSWWPHQVIRVSCESGEFADSRFSLNCWMHRARDT